MSISSMTNVAMSRRVDVQSEEPVPTSTSAIVAATAGPQEARNGVVGAMQVIMTYVLQKSSPYTPQSQQQFNLYPEMAVPKTTAIYRHGSHLAFA